MTEPDRGAYTPQSEVSLSFDPRDPRERRPAPMTLIASGAVLLVLVAAVFMAYRHGARGRQGPAQPIGTPVVAIRSAPPGGAPPRASDSERDVFAAQNVPSSSAPVFTRPPEQPKPRITTSQLEVRSVEPVPVRIDPQAAAPSPTTVARAPAAGGSTVIHGGEADAGAGRTIASIAPRSPGADRAATATIDAALARSEVRPAAAPPSAASGAVGAGVQIGAFSSRALADQGYADASALMAGAMAGRAKSITPVPKDGKTLFRTVITGFPDHAAARAFCATLSSRGHTCIVKG